MRRLFPQLMVLAALTSLSSLVHADLPPPDGTRFVEYKFRVDGSAKFPGYVLFVYPWSASSGVPTKEFTKAPDGSWVSVGRRSSPPVIYAVKQATLDEFLKTYTPAKSFEDDPAMSAFLAKNAKCDLAPNPDFSVAASDPRDVITEVFVAASITDTVCHLTKGGEAKTGGVAEPPAAPTDNTKTEPATPPNSTAKSGGCAGCVVGEGQLPASSVLFGLFLGLFSFARRRRAQEDAA